MRIFDNPLNHWIQRRTWLKGGLHHAIIAAAVLTLTGWIGLDRTIVGTVIITYYWSEGIGYLSCKRDMGRPVWTWRSLQDPLTDALWPTALVVGWWLWIV